MNVEDSSSSSNGQSKKKKRDRQTDRQGKKVFNNKNNKKNADFFEIVNRKEAIRSPRDYRWNRSIRIIIRNGDLVKATRPATA